MAVLLGYLHSLAMIALGALLLLQLVTLDRLHEPRELQRFFSVGAGVAAAAAAMLVTGLALLAWSGQPAAFYVRNPVFYIKLAIFAAMLLVAVTPARIILQWRGQAGSASSPAPASVAVLRRYLFVELALFVSLPLLASLLGHGVGLQPAPA